MTPFIPNSTLNPLLIGKAHTSLLCTHEESAKKLFLFFYEPAGEHVLDNSSHGDFIEQLSLTHKWKSTNTLEHTENYSWHNKRLPIVVITVAAKITALGQFQLLKVLFPVMATPCPAAFDTTCKKTVYSHSWRILAAWKRNVSVPLRFSPFILNIWTIIQVFCEG